MSTFGNSELDIEMDTSGFGVEDAQPKQGGAAVNKPGMYHVQVLDVKKEGGEGKTKCLRLDLNVLAGTEEDQIGKKIYHRIYLEKLERDKEGKLTGTVLPLSEGQRKEMLKIAFQLGLIGEDVIGQTVRVPWSMAVNRQAIVKVEAEESKDAKDPTRTHIEHRIKFGNFWNVHHEDVAEAPKDPEAMLTLVAPNPANVATNIDEL